MGLLSRASPIETWGELERAASARYWDALALALEDRRHAGGAAYMFGYAVEMLLKTAYYRVVGVRRAADVSLRRQQAGARARALGFRWVGNYHNLESWARLILEERRALGRPVSAALAGVFIQRVLVVASHWSEVLRYKHIAATSGEVRELFEAVEWIRGEHRSLWR